VKLRQLALPVAAAAAALTVAAAAPAAHAAPARTALPAGFVLAKQVPSSLGPGWTAVQWKAESGGGCADPADDSNLEPVVSQVCGIWTWEERSIGTVPNHGTMIELVDPAGDYGVEFSAGEWKLAKPSTGVNGTWFVELTDNGCSAGWCLDANAGLTNYAAPNGKNDDLKAPGSGSLPADGWGQF
jgi:hypothetical protein